MALTENGGFSLADVMAMANGTSGTWIWVFFLLAWGGNGFFGGNNAVAGGALTRAELYNGLGQQDVFRNQNEIALALIQLL